MEIEDMKEEVEKKLREYFPNKWKQKDVDYYLGKQRFEIDLNAVNKNLSDPTRDFILRGGKRIRPVLFLACIELFGDNPKKYLDFAVFVELVHNGTLVLDDIEDDGALRRGKPTCHKTFGVDTATNVGLGLHILPLKILMSAEKKLTSRQSRRIWNIYSQELINISFGQSLDIYWHKHSPDKVTVDNYLEMVRLKTGSLMRMSMRMACALTNRTVETERLFSNFAESIGMAFQIVDDCLDLDPQDEKFGKIYGNDITEGKLSLPVIYTLNSASKEDALNLVEIIKKHTRNKQLISEAIAIIKKYESIKKARVYAKSIVDNAWKELEKKWEYRNNLEKLRALSYMFVSREY